MCRKTSFLSILLLLFSVKILPASDLKLTTPVLYLEGDQAFAVFNISWDNSWNNDKNNDAVWIFFKSIPRNGQALHISVLPDSHIEVASFSDGQISLEFETAEDSTGLFISPSGRFKGNIHATVKISLEREQFNFIRNRTSLFRVFGIEMVKIPEGKFTLGEPSETARSFGSIYDPNSSSLPEISNENSEIVIGKSGDIYYQNHEGYEGDQTGTLSSDFPKGVSCFYMMKYEITEGQYVSFLNSLKGDMLALRNISRADFYSIDGGTIYFEENQFKTNYGQKPAIFLSWTDMMAFADWAALRPMTEFEFTKASRGPRTPMEYGFPWGTNSKYQVQRLPDENGMLIMRNNWTEEMLSEETLPLFGASYYWVMDLSGSLWERMITIGHEQGRAFIGSHGDGVLSQYGTATNSDWPSGESNSGGVGFRGGGFYGYTREYHSYNPFSPISYRPYGGWHGVDRSKAYGGRLVRTSN